MTEIDGAAGAGAGAAPTRRVGPLRVAAWALWDWGSAAFNAVITTFVFTSWLMSSAFVDPDTVARAGAEGSAGGPASDALEAILADHSAWLGWGLAGAGLLIALVAPVAGARSDDFGRRRLWLGVHTATVVALSASLFFIRPVPGSLTENLVLGVFLLAAANIFFELAVVNYNATLLQVSTPRNVGRIGGIGWGAGYLGGIVLLVILFVGFIDPDVGWFGVTGEDGLNVRVATAFAALWFAVFSLPVLFALPEVRPSGARARLSLAGSYRQLARDIMALWHGNRNTLRFLLASAIYRDGLAGVFVFGAAIAAVTFGFTAREVVIFAIAANVVAGVCTIAAGYLDDVLGPKTIIVGALVGLLCTGTTIAVLHDGGPVVFWVFGLLLSVFVGPAQSSSRTLLTSLIPPGRGSELFGLYATAGRAASFLAPVCFAALIALTGAQHWGILGLMAVLALGLALLLPLRVGTAAARPADLDG